MEYGFGCDDLGLYDFCEDLGFDDFCEDLDDPLDDRCKVLVW